MRGSAPAAAQPESSTEVRVFEIAQLPHTFPLLPDPRAIELAMGWASPDAQRQLVADLAGRCDGFAISIRTAPNEQWMPEHRFWSNLPGSGSFAGIIWFRRRGIG